MRLSLPTLLFAIHLGLGMLVLWFALVGRRQHDRPICAACGTDLRPVASEEHPRCSDCGGELSRARSVRFASRGRSKGLIAAAMLMLLATPLWPTMIWDWMRPTPPRPIARTALGMPVPPGWDEIGKDAALDKKSPARLTRGEAVGHLTRAAKEIEQGRGSDPHWWNHGLYRAISAMLANGQITPDEAKPIFGALLENQVELILQRGVRENRPVQARFMFYGLESNGSWYQCRPVAFMHGATRSLAARKESPMKAVTGRPGPHPDDLEITHALPPGEYDVHLECVLELHTDKATFTWPRLFPAKLRVTPTTEPAVQLVNDPDLAARIVKAVGLQEFYITPGIYQKFVNAVWQFDSASDVPVYYFDVWVMLGGQAHRVGTLRNPPYQWWPRWSGQSPLPPKFHLPADATTVTVRLVPNPEEAEKLLGADKLPAEPIILKDVPLKRYDLPGHAEDAR